MASPVILYQFPGGDSLSSLSPPCMKIEMALRYLEIDHEVKNLRSSVEVSKISPSGRVPAIVIGGETIIDSISVMDRLDAMCPGKLGPSDPSKKRQDILWEHFVNDHMYWLGFYLRWIAHPEAMYKATFSRLPFYVRGLVKMTFLPQLKKRGYAHGVGRKSRDQVWMEMNRAIQMLDDGLEGGPFLQGEPRIGRGDLAAASLLAQAGFRNTLPEYRQRLEQHPRLIQSAKAVFEACSMTIPPAFEAQTA